MAVTMDGPVATGPPTVSSVRTGASRLALSQAFQYVARLATSIALARLLAPRDFGLLGLVSVLVVLLQRTLGDGGMVTALVQRQHVTRELTSSVFFFNVLVGITTTTVLVATAPWISGVLGDTAATGVLRGMALTFAIAACAKVPQAMLRRDMRYGAVAALGSANAFVTAAVAIPLAIAGHGVASLVVGQVAAVGAETVLAWRLSRWRPSRRFRWGEVRSVSSFARNLAAFNLVNYLSDAGDKFLVGRFVGTASLGLYTLPYRLLFAPVFAIAQVYRDLLLPIFARNQHDHEAIARHYLRAVGSMALVTLPVCALTSALAQPLVDAGLGERWHDAGPILTVMALVAMVQSILVTGGIILSAKGRTDILLRWGVVAGVTMFAFYGVGTRWGALGVASGFLLGTATLAYPAMAIPFRQIDLPVRRLLVAIAPAAASTVVMAVVAIGVRYATESAGWSSGYVAGAGVLAAGAGYAAAVLSIRPVALTDLLSIVRRRSVG